MPVLEVPDNAPLTAWMVVMRVIAAPGIPGSGVAPTHHNMVWRGLAGAVAAFLVKVGLSKPSRDNPGLYTDLVHDAAVLPRDLDATVAERSDGRTMVAELLQTTLSLHRHEPKRASIENAIRIMQARHEADDLATSRSAFFAEWARYRSVAPYLVAYRLLGAKLAKVEGRLDGIFGGVFAGAFAGSFEEEFAPLWEGDGASGKPDETLVEAEGAIDEEAVRKAAQEAVKAAEDIVAVVTKFLAMAQRIGLDAGQAYAHGQKVHDHPLIKPDEWWRLPDGLELPEITVEYPKLSKADRRVLRQPIRRKTSPK